MNNTDLDMLASANRRARDSLTEEAYAVLWKHIRAVTSDYLDKAKPWFEGMPDDKWGANAAHQTGIMPHINQATRELTVRISALIRQAAVDIRRRCYLRGIKAAQVGQEIVGHEPVQLLDAVFRPKRESMRINGARVTMLGNIVAGKRITVLRETETALPNTTTIDKSIQGKDLDRVLVIIDAIPSAIKCIPKRIVLADLGGVHGEWENGTIRLNPSVFTSKQEFHTSDTHGKVDQLTHALVHEYMHAWGEHSKLDTLPAWLQLSGWQYSPEETPEGTQRYVEKREGWPKEPTEWAHATDAWFTRPYSGKSPEEDFADCARDWLLGWDEEFESGGEAKHEYIASCFDAIGVRRDIQREAGEWDEEKHPRDDKGRWTTGGGGGMSRPETTDEKGTKGRSAQYHDAAGNPVDAATQARLDALKLPPAWTDVRLNPDPNGALQAVGRDSKGRMQYVYSAAHSEAAAAEKFARLAEFTKELPAIREQINATLNNPDASASDRDAAIVLTLIDRTGFRIGSDNETGGAKQAYGASTLRADHVQVDGDKLSFNFTGKKGVEQSHSFEDKQLASLIAPKMQAGGRLFNVSDSQVRDYLHAKDGDFKVKDYRTYNGTATAIKEMTKLPKPKSEKEFTKSQKVVAKAVAQHLGNTPAIALTSYIDPTVWGRWRH